MPCTLLASSSTTRPRSAQRLGGGLENADDAQPGLPVGRAASSACSMQSTNCCSLDAERLGDVELRRPHVAGAVADQHLVDASRRRLVAVEGDALVVDLDLFARLEVVVDDHLAAAADQRAAHLHRRQPVHVDVGDQVALEEQRQIGDVLRLAGDVADAGRRDRDRLLGRT